MKNLVRLAEFLLSIVSAWIISYLFFDKDSLMLLFFFVLFYGGNNGTKILSEKKEKFLCKILLFLSVLGVVLIVLGKQVFCNDIIVIIGAMFLTLFVPVIVKVGIDIVQRIFTKNTE